VPHFTTEEAYLINYLATERDDSRRLWFYAAVLIAPVAIAVFGVVQKDYVAVAVGFFGLLSIVVWYISDERQHAKHYRAICQKLAQAGINTPKEGHDA
jgi:hypothetical protein